MADSQVVAQQDAAVALADYAANVQYERLPGEVVTRVKEIVLDTLGTTLAANTLGVGCRELVEVARSAGGTPESTLLGFGDKVPAVPAALANGAMAHALNYDDTTGEGGVHLGPTSLPAALAAAERRGGVSGKELIAALAAGCEVVSRIGVAVKRAEEGTSEAKPQPTQMPGYFSAAVSAGRVMKFTLQQMHSAMGLALMQAAGNRQVVLEGTPAKAIYTGFSNQGGMLSALLVERGLRADCAVFEGEAGLFNTFYHGRYFRPAFETGIGEHFYMARIGFKPWPISGVAHPFMEAALELLQTHAIDVASIDDVHIRGGTRIRPWCEPMAARKKPQTSVEAEDSIYFGVAKMLANGNLVLADFTPDGLRQAESVRLAERMRYSLEDDLGRAGVLEISTVSGQRYTCRVDTPLGHPSKPLPYERLVEKFVDCAQHAAHPQSRHALDEAIDLVAHLEDVPDVAVLPALLSRPQ